MWIKIYQMSIPIILLALGGSVGYDKVQSYNAPPGVALHDHPDNVQLVDRVRKLERQVRGMTEKQLTWHGK